MSLREMTPTRRQILELVHREPGLSTTRIGLVVGVCASTAEHHLHRLGRMGEIVSERVGRVCAHYPNGWGDRRARVLATLSSEARIALVVVREKYHARASDVARETGLPIGAARAALDLAEKRGLVARLSGGRFVEVSS